MAPFNYSGHRLQRLEQGFSFALKKIHFISLIMMMTAAF
jgi:hypothetical protein